MFYCYRQNNSGGNWQIDESAGISVLVIIEADSPDAADDKAESIGLYFGGCASGKDCSCCGDRWNTTDTWDESEQPEYCGTPIAPYEACPGPDQGLFLAKWTSEGVPDGFIHYADGSCKPFWATTAARTDLDGTCGWGVVFNQTATTVFLCGKNGWDATGMYEAAAHKDEPIVVTNPKSKYGKAWFPTEEQAREFARHLDTVRESMQDAIHEAAQGVAEAAQTPTMAEAMRIWQ